MTNFRVLTTSGNLIDVVTDNGAMTEQLLNILQESSRVKEIKLFAGTSQITACSHSKVIDKFSHEVETSPVVNVQVNVF